VIEPSLGLDRLALMVLTQGLVEETLENDSRIVLKIHL
jgi:glycyl-tRNA synthetase (class II)